MQGGIRGAVLVVIALSTLQVVLAMMLPAQRLLAQSCEVELTIEQPAENAEVSPQQRITGWAVDRAAEAGVGIEAVRMAFDVMPDDADEHQFVSLEYGLSRPDVAGALDSPEFTAAGFDQEWPPGWTLPGRHQLLVQAKSACGWTSILHTIHLPFNAREASPVQETLAPPAPEIATHETVAQVSRSTAPPLPVMQYAGPSRPTRFALAASEGGPTSVALQWAAVPGAGAYSVYVGEESVAPTSQAPAGWLPGAAVAGFAAPPRLLGVSGLQRLPNPLAATTATVSGLNAGATYRFVVRALAENGAEIAESQAARVSLPAVPPNPLTATPSVGSVSLSWDAVPDAATYAVLASSGNRPLLPDPLRASITATSTSIDRLPPGVYTFQVEARDVAGGRLTRSNVAQVIVEPSAPSLIGANLGPSATVAPGVLPAPATGLSPAVSPSGGSPTLVAGPGGSVPVSSSGAAGFRLTIARTSANSARLDWPMLLGAGSFAVYQAQGDTPLALAFTTGNPGTTVTGLVSGVSYTFQVRARNAADLEYAMSNTVTLDLAR